jgi:hypothetical protein
VKTEQDRRAASVLYDWLIGSREDTLSYLEAVIATAREEGRKAGIEQAAQVANAQSKKDKAESLVQIDSDRQAHFIVCSLTGEMIERHIRELMEAQE